MNDPNAPVKQFIKDAIDDVNVEVVTRYEPVPVQKPYIVFSVTGTPSMVCDSFTFDSDTENMKQYIIMEYLVNINGVGEGVTEPLFKVYTAAGYSEQQVNINSDGFAIYDRSAPENAPHVTEIEKDLGAKMTIRIRGHEERVHTVSTIETVELTGTYTSDDGGEIKTVTSIIS